MIVNKYFTLLSLNLQYYEGSEYLSNILNWTRIKNIFFNVYGVAMFSTAIINRKKLEKMKEKERQQKKKGKDKI